MESSPPRRSRPLLCGALAAVVVLGGTFYGTSRTHRAAGTVSSSSAPVSGSASPPAGEEAAVERVARPTVDRDAVLARALRAVDVPDGARLSVGVLDLASGESATYGKGAFDTASVVKVDILCALLLRAQDAGRGLTAAERADAAAMIEHSDNASASRLWRAIGGAAGLDAANGRFGLTGTEGGDGMLWGLTRTTAADQLRLLRQVFGEDSELGAGSRAYVRALMGRIAEGQRWGVSAAADGSGWALKNGWLPRTATGLWDVNSVGRVTAGGRELLVAVLSDRHTTQARGISVVEAAAVAAVSVFSGSGGSA
ncbi:serine hydrolase [Streptomyces sp. NPDC046928]|uniref:serine hydrolase n=1 Tax=Streptomyces sp. NPDC046928 TaxID=3155021 RepID=UPI0033D2724C